MTLFPLHLKQAVARHRGVVLVGPVTLTLASQTGTTIVLGPNGAGKTSLLRLMQGAARVASGSVDWACPMPQARRQQAFVFQHPVMLRRSVLDNLMYPLRLRGTDKATARAHAQAWAARVGLSDMLERPAPVLSGGERQKLALARALITDPQVVFLDEPCAALDGRAMREIETILTQTAATGTRLILSTHDMGQARRLADDVVFMLHGQVHETARAAAFFAGPRTPEARAFLQGDIVE